MSSQDTIELDPDDLSEDVVTELVEKDIMDEEQAKEVGKKVWFEETVNKDPTKTPFSEYIMSLLSSIFIFISNVGSGIFNKSLSLVKQYIPDKFQSIKQRTLFADVVSVDSIKNSSDITESKIKLTLHHPKTNPTQFEVELDLNSNELSNLMEYKSIENPKQLEDKEILLTENSFFCNGLDKPGIVIPHNVSLSGTLRFKLYSAVREIYRKTRIKSIYPDNFDYGFFFYVVTGVLSLSIKLGLEDTILEVLGTISIVLWSTVFGLHMTHFIFSTFTFLIAFLFKSNFHKVKKH